MRNDTSRNIYGRRSEWSIEITASITPAATLRRHRKLRHMTRRKLMQKLGGGYLKLVAMEKGRINIDNETAAKLSQIFKTSETRFKERINGTWKMGYELHESELQSGLQSIHRGD